MTISGFDNAQLSADGSSDWVALRVGLNSISVHSPTWGGATSLALQQSDDGEEATMSTVKVDGAAFTTGENDRIMVFGPGYVRGVVTGYAGSGTITIKRVSPN